MAIPNFTSGIPQNGQSLGNSKPIVRDNLDGTFQTLSVDHQNQNSPNPGYHSVIHFQNQGSDPADVPGVLQLYSKNAGVSPTPELFFRPPGAAAGIQLSAFFTPTAATNGASFLPGGIVMQWGRFNVVTDPGIVPFNFSFSGAPYIVNATLQSGAAESILRLSIAPTSTGFNYSIDNPGGPTVIHWLAIGSAGV